MEELEKKPINKKRLVFFLAAFFAGCVGVFFLQYRMPTAEVTLGGETLRVQVANTPARQYKGLGGKDSLGRYDGMLFLMGEPDTYAFVMRNMRFSIDIIWLYRGEVVDIAPSVPLDTSPEAELKRYRPRKEATMILEVPAGWTASHGIKIGDRMTLPGEELSP